MLNLFALCFQVVGAHSQLQDFKKNGENSRQSKKRSEPALPFSRYNAAIAWSPSGTARGKKASSPTPPVSNQPLNRTDPHHAVTQQPGDAHRKSSKTWCIRVPFSGLFQLFRTILISYAAKGKSIILQNTHPSC